MERLTFVDEKGRILFTPKGCDEDAGYTIIQLIEGGHIELLKEIASRLANYEQRLGYYDSLEEQGRLPKLPCAVGDTVYEVQRVRKRIQSYDIVAIKISRMGARYYYWELKDGKGFYGNLKGFGDMRLGVDVFLTKGEAGAALERMKENDKRR